MMKGASDQQRQEWEMPPDQKFSWLPNSEKTLEGFCQFSFSDICLDVLEVFGMSVFHFTFSVRFHVSVEDCFQETVEAMVSLGIDADKRAQIFRVSSATRPSYGLSKIIGTLHRCEHKSRLH